MLWVIISATISCISLGICTFWGLKLKKDRQNLKDDEQSIIDEMSERISIIDDEINNAFLKLQEMNSVVFDCPCSHNTVRTFIDLSKKENTFVCPECKNEYRIDITMVPILKGKIVDEQGMYKLLSTKLENARNDKAK